MAPNTMALLSRCLLLLLAAAISTTTTTTNALVPPAKQQQRHAIVVGAGPVGIATALTLATNHNYTLVTLLDSQPASSSQSKYDPTKAFLYNVNARGQRFTKQYPNLQRKLEERSVGSKGFGGTVLTIVPSDPGEEIPMQKKNMPEITKDEGEDEDGDEEGEAAETGGDMKQSLESEKAAAKGYWLPRHEMVKLMSECIDEHNNDDSDCKIQFLMGKECLSVLPAAETATAAAGENDDGVCVTVKNAEDGSVESLRAALVVGADGMNSKVRECIAAASSDTWQSHKGFRPDKFKLKQWTSPASHLRIKVLQLPPQFEIPNANGLPPLKTKSEDIYAVRSANTGPRSYLSLGLLPMKDNTAVRPTNIVTRPDHEVWTISDGPAMQSYFQKAYPRFDFSAEDGIISAKEWERFAKAEGTRFPHCQYSEGMAVWDEGGTCGVALVGDAIHAFPPDIGQGVNAGLMDVVCLDRALGGRDPETGKMEETAVPKEGPPTLGSNLEQYQKRHAPETAALIRLARFGSPYQYKQPHRADRILQKVWMANVVLRLLLSKVTFGLVQPSCIVLSQDGDLTFKQVMRRSDSTTLGLRAVVLGVAALWFKRKFGFGFLKTLLA